VRGKAVSMAKVTLTNIKKVYDKNVTAVHDFNLEIADKEFIVLVGPSGCGKSTTLRMVAGLEEITDGELHIDDKLVNAVPPKDRDIAMVFQNYALYPHMTVYENLAFALKLRKEKKDEIDRKVKQAAEILGITDLLKRKPKALSGGQRQRVAIGRAIVREPKVFLMDEPLSNLDAKLRNQMRAEIIKLRERIDTTFIYVTHDQIEAMTLGDRIVIMKDGYIMQIGTSQDVFNRPANKFVAGFIGTPQMNFFDAELALSGGNYVVRVSGIELMLSSDKQKILQQKKQEPCKMILGIRPEHINVVTADTPNAIKAKVDVSEMMGSEIYLHVVVGEKDVVIRVQIADMMPQAFEPGKSNYIHFEIPESMVHLFDAESENNLLY
jgi:multiple sugar transport system ATP-binding protein